MYFTVSGVNDLTCEKIALHRLLTKHKSGSQQPFLTFFVTNTHHPFSDSPAQ